MFTTAAALAADGGFLFVTFKGEATPMTEQIYFLLSKDGRRWEGLNGAQPVLISQVGQKGARDPYLLRSRDGKKFYIIASDLSINHKPIWRNASRAGSKSILVWESGDLVHWSEPRLVQVAADDAGCAWAPEAVYDEDVGDYLVFWASRNASDHFAKFRIWAARTKDFKTFGKPFVYVDKPYHVIDTNIIRNGGRYYRFSKDEKHSTIVMENAERLRGPWREMPQFSLAKLHGYEGPQCFLLEPATARQPSTWCLLLDHYRKGEGYKPFLSPNLSGGQFTPAPDFKFPFRLRHGSVLPITATEYTRLKAAYGELNSAR